MDFLNFVLNIVQTGILGWLVAKILIEENGWR